jgi:hypothetical protein
MNEQIQKLLNVCGMPNEDLMDIYSDTNKSFYMQKFAELIVGECMACSTWVGKVNNNAIEPVHTAHAINQCIKKHFGVEE